MSIYYKKFNRNDSETVHFLDKPKNYFITPKKHIFNINSIDNDLNSTVPTLSERCNSSEEWIQTKYGPTLIIKQGVQLDGKAPIILTYHDIGLNFESNFDSFFSLTENRAIIKTFSIIHINAPGQDGTRLPQDYRYPTMDELSEQLNAICIHLNIKSYIGFGVGAGSNILIRHALQYPEKVDGLFLINPICNQSSWSEWLFSKISLRVSYQDINASFLSDNVQQYLIWHHFGRDNEQRNDNSRDIIDHFRTYFKGITLNPYNLKLFIQSFVKRTTINLSRNGNTLKCQTMLLTASLSPYLEATIDMNSKCNPECTTWMKLSDCSMVLEEKPHKVVQAFHLFLQGLSYPLKDYEKRKARLSGISLPCSFGTN